MATQLIANGTTAANSADLVVAAGTPVTIVLNSIVDDDAQVRIEIKDPASAYNAVGLLTSSAPATVIIAPGTYRFTRIAGGSCGVLSA